MKNTCYALTLTGLLLAGAAKAQVAQDSARKELEKKQQELQARAAQELEKKRLEAEAKLKQQAVKGLGNLLGGGKKKTTPTPTPTPAPTDTAKAGGN